MFFLVKTLAAGTAVFLLAGMQPAAAGSGDAQSQQSDAAQSAGNPLRQEMIKLDAVFRDVVSGVAVRDGARVREAIEGMHGTMEKTHEGVRQGRVTLPKNAGRMQEFIAQDKQFHAKLEELADAAGKNDSGKMVKLAQGLLARCVRCHSEFRK